MFIGCLTVTLTFNGWGGGALYSLHSPHLPIRCCNFLWYNCLLSLFLDFGPSCDVSITLCGGKNCRKRRPCSLLSCWQQFMVVVAGEPKLDLSRLPSTLALMQARIRFLRVESGTVLDSIIFYGGGVRSGSIFSLRFGFGVRSGSGLISTGIHNPSVSFLKLLRIRNWIQIRFLNGLYPDPNPQ